MISNHRLFESCEFLIKVFPLLMLASCGGNQSALPNLSPQFVTEPEVSVDENSTPPNLSPQFMTESEISVDENSTSIAATLATDPDNDQLTFTVSGPDAAAVDISKDGNMRFRSAKDFEAPTSVDGDNLYEVTVEVSDGESAKSEQFNITVIDKSELYLNTYFPFEEDEVNYSEFSSVESAMAVDELFSTNSRLWGFKFISDQAYMTTRQDGVFFLHDLVTDQKYSFDVASKISLYTEGQGGLFNFDFVTISDTKFKIYFAASIVTQQDGYSLALYRLEMTLDGEPTFSDPVKLFEAEPDETSNQHFGGDILLVGDALYATSGDRRCRECAQSTDRYNGKVLRFQIQPDASLVAHPQNTVNTGTRKEIFSLGHRNPQGIDLVPEFGEIVVSEHGPQGGDEINFLSLGANFGWPLVTLGEEYGGGLIGATQLPGYKDSVTHYIPSIAPRGIKYVHENQLFPELNNSFLIASLKFELILVLSLDTNRPRHRYINLSEFGRISSLDVNSAGEIFFATHSTPGKVFRIR